MPAPHISLPANSVVPDYGDRGLFALVSSFADYLDGCPWRPPAIPAGSPPPIAEHRSLVFILIDGLGDHFLQTHGVGSALLAHRTARLTSVFPSTTASAVTTTLTGLTPARHGLTGWFIHDKRFGGVLAPLPMIQRTGDALRGPWVAQRLFPYRALFQRRKRPSAFISPARLAHSPYSRRHARGAHIIPYRGLSGMVDAIAAALQDFGSNGGYIHAYYPVFDALSHTHGSTSPQVIDEFWRIDKAFTKLLERPARQAYDVVVSADHGFIDAPPDQRLELEQFPDLKAMLATPLFGEPRAAFTRVRTGAEIDFQAFAEHELAGKAIVLPSRTLLEARLLGPGKPHRRLPERVGTHTLLMEPGWVIRDRIERETPHAMIGFHGGLSPQEMHIPLIHVRG